MEIIRKKIVSDRQIELQQILKESSLFEMNEDDIKDDGIVENEKLAENQLMLVFQNKEQNYSNERYCYLKLKKHIGGDKQTIAIEVDEIIVDSKLIDVQLFTLIFGIMFQMLSETRSDRIVVGKFNDRFHLNQDKLAGDIAVYLCDCFNDNTSDVCPSCTIPNNFPRE